MGWLPRAALSRWGVRPSERGHGGHGRRRWRRDGPGLAQAGIAQAAVSALVDAPAQLGGEALYKCGPANAASISTARSVGFVPYATSLILAAPLPQAA